MKEINFTMDKFIRI